MHKTGVRIGAALWILAAQFFIAQVVVAAAWPTPFSLTTRYISDLGNTACGDSICSPWHAWMNASFVLIGVTMAAGACFARPAFAPGRLRDSAVILFIVAGFGVLLVGVFPENEHNVPHTVGAGLNFFGGNAALILFGLAADRRPGRAFALFSVVSGIVGLVATVLFGVKQFLVIGVGGMERLAAYPMPIWQIVAGLRLWRYKP